MKKLIVIFGLVLLQFSCKKERVCTCDVSSSSERTSSPLNGTAPQHSSSVSTNTVNTTFENMSRKEVHAENSCQNRTEISVYTYTSTVLDAAGATINAKTKVKNTNTYKCEIK